MKILILDGSPHPNGTTSLLRKAFAEGALSAGHTVDTFHTAKEDLHPCLGCNHCRNTGDGCVYKDGMENLNPLLLMADCVVFSTPLYYFGMSAQIKMAIDRFLPIIRSSGRRKSRQCCWQPAEIRIPGP